MASIQFRSGPCEACGHRFTDHLKFERTKSGFSKAKWFKCSFKIPAGAVNTFKECPCPAFIGGFSDGSVKNPCNPSFLPPAKTPCELCGKYVFSEPAIIDGDIVRACTKCHDQAKRRGAYGGRPKKNPLPPSGTKAFGLRRNPLTRKETNTVLLRAKWSAAQSRKFRRVYGREEGEFSRGASYGRSATALEFGPKNYKKRAAKVAARIEHYAMNPKERKAVLIGPRLKRIVTSKGELIAASKASIWGLSDGSVFIQGFFLKVPAGDVRVIEYFDDAKAKREGLSNPSRPWRHDFTSEGVCLKRTRGGLLIRCGKNPLWGKR